MKDTRGAGGSPASTALAVADAAVVTWKAIAEALVPVIGQSAMTVSFRRCLASVGVERTGLSFVDAADLPENDWTVLHACLSRLTAKDAFETCAAIINEFSVLMASLIGALLTEELLRPVSALPTGRAAQDHFQ